jgi:hypothetical protein
MRDIDRTFFFSRFRSNKLLKRIIPQPRLQIKANQKVILLKLASNVLFLLPGTI